MHRRNTGTVRDKGFLARPQNHDRRCSTPQEKSPPTPNKPHTLTPPRKVWKKQPGGPPVLPSDTRSELKEALSSMSTTNFEGKIRSMLALVNAAGGEDRDNDEIRLPASFPVEEVNQVGKS